MEFKLRRLAGFFFTDAIRALSRNKVRTGLTILGIMIGIAAVVCVVAIGKAGSEAAEAQLQRLGDNLVQVEAGSRNVNGVRSGTHGMNTLTAEDAEAILRDVPLIKSVSPHVDGSIQVAYGNRNWNTQYRGVSPDYLSIRSWKVAEGAPFTDASMEHAESVCLIGQTLRKQVFGSEDPVGKIIRIQSQLFQVVGVLETKGQSAMGRDQDDVLLLPYTTAQKKLRGRGFLWLDDIMASAVSREAINPAIDRIILLLRQRHMIRPGQEDDFNIRRPDEIINAQIKTSHSLAGFLIAIASISLLVGSIGIMNVMLVTVAERTKEIGLRLAVGATPGVIRMQFLGEAVMLSLFGGLWGVVLGVVASLIIGRVLEWPISIPMNALVIAPAVCIAVGVFFGFYPAWMASRLDPIAALRHE